LGACLGGIGERACLLEQSWDGMIWLGCEGRGRRQSACVNWELAVAVNETGGPPMISHV
jgi:hypothetical protein